VTVAELDGNPVLAPVTITLTSCALVKVQANVLLPEPVTLVGLRVHEVLFVVRLTAPAKLPCAVTVIVEVPTAFTVAVTLVGLAVTTKPAARSTLYVTVDECD